jgi:acetyl-CoA carboxylase biotin carboxylase subunit
VILRRMLVANRGEIAVRVIRTCRRLGIETVLTVADADADSVPARLADKTIAIGSYLDVEEVVGAAAAAGARAIHPGYGFLSENPRLARACEAAGIVFIGPGADVLEAAGDKLAARNHAVAAGLPVLPGGLVRGEATGADGARGAAAGAGCGWSGIRRTSPGRSRWAARRRRRRSGTGACTWSGTSPPRGTWRCSCSATGRT